MTHWKVFFWKYRVSFETHFRKKISCVSWKLSQVFSFRKQLSVISASSILESFLSQTEFCDWSRVYVVNNDIKWTGDKVLHLIYLLKDVPALYVVNWIYVGHSHVRVSCLCSGTLGHQLFAAQVAAMYKLPAFNVPLYAVHDRVRTNQCLHLQTALVNFGWLRQTPNKKRQTLHRYENRLPLSTENFGCKLSSVTWPTFESLLSKIYFRKLLSKENFPVCHDL